MKKLFTILMIAMLLCLSLTACGNKSKKEPDDNTNSSIQSSKTSNIQEPQKEDEIWDVDDWGVQEKIVAGKNDTLTTAYIKFPTLSGIVRGTGKIAYQKNKTLVILDAERKTGSPALTNDSCDNVFPAYFEQTKGIIDTYRQMNYDNFEFSISDKEIVTVNGYEMCKFTGKHTFTVKDVNTFETKNAEMNFVAYATKLNGNGAYVYWMVLDESDDQSLTKTIEEYADKMAKTLSE